METRERLIGCQEFIEQTQFECRLELKGEGENPFDLLFLPAFQRTDTGEVMPLCIYFAEGKHLYREKMQYDMLHLMGYLEHVASGSVIRELRAFFGEVNFQMPVGAFDVDADGTVFLRYTLPIPQEMPQVELIRQFGIAFSMLNIFALVFLKPAYAIIRGECTAKKAMDMARAELDKAYDVLHQNGEENE